MKSKCGDEELALQHPDMLLRPLPSRSSICAQTPTRSLTEGGDTDTPDTDGPWGVYAGAYCHNRVRWLGLKTLGPLVYCAPPGHVFVCQVDKQLWATKRLTQLFHTHAAYAGNFNYPFPFLILSLKEPKHWASSLKPCTQLTRHFYPETSQMEIPISSGTHCYHGGGKLPTNVSFGTCLTPSPP